METYEEIVKKWYLKMRGSFTDILLDRYRNSDLSLADAENIYQNIFLAIHRNLEEGRIRENCDWRNYIIRVGLNLASKRHRSLSRLTSIDDGDDTDDESEGRRAARAARVEKAMQALGGEGDEVNLYTDPESKALLGIELEHTPEPCASIIRLSYFSDMPDTEIAETILPYRDNGKDPKVNAKAVKARRWLCMRDLIYRVKTALFNAGIIDERPTRGNKTQKGGPSNG